MSRKLSVFVCLLTVILIAVPAAAQTEPGTESTSAVAATVGDDPVTVAEAQRLTDLVFPNKKKPTGDLLPMAQAQVLEEIVNRRLVMAYAQRVDETPSALELAKAEKQFQVLLAAQGRKVSDVLKSESMTLADLKRQILWQLLWDRYLAKYRTPKRRETWFQNHHSELDGTQLVVSHILLRPAAGASLKEIDELERQAASIRAEIVSGKIDFAAAAQKYSAGPSSKQGGKIGKIGRYAPQEESFSRAAFQLKPGEISPPIRSRFGVHLIRCEEVLPGTKKVSDLTGPIDEALAKELLEKISQAERQKTEVKYTSAWPHFKPGTRELAK